MQNVADRSLKGIQNSVGALLSINCFEVRELTPLAVALEDMQKPRADPAEFKSALSNKLKRKHLVTPSDSSLKKKKNEVVEAKTLPTVSSSTAPSFTAASAPTTKVVSVPPTHPADPEPVSIRVEPADYLDALKVGFPHAKEFSHVVHEALLDHPAIAESNCASRSVNLFSLQSENFELVKGLAKEKTAWLNEREAFRAEAREASRLVEQVSNERDHLQSTLLKQGEDLEEALKRHINLKAKYHELCANGARTEAKLLSEVSSLHSQVSDQRNTILELLAEIKGLREKKDTRGKVDWEVAIEMPEFEPVHKVLFAMAMKSTKEAVLTRFPDLNLDFLEFEDDEVEDIASKAVDPGPKGKRTAGDEAGASKAAEVGENIEDTTPQA